MKHQGFNADRFAAFAGRLGQVAREARGERQRDAYNATTRAIADLERALQSLGAANIATLGGADSELSELRAMITLATEHARKALDALE